jgi:uncharacterized damage-inducible protein DinB
MYKPLTTEYLQSPYHSRYIDKVANDNSIEALAQQQVDTLAFFRSLTEEQLNYRYAEGKWSVKEILGHITDTERIMAYRALCIARGEQQALPGFEENDYVVTAHFDKRTITDLLREYTLVREANLALFRSFDETMLTRIGNASGRNISVRALLFIIAGHELHHLKVIRERYL